MPAHTPNSKPCSLSRYRRVGLALCSLAITASAPTLGFERAAAPEARLMIATAITQRAVVEQEARGQIHEQHGPEHQHEGDDREHAQRADSDIETVRQPGAHTEEQAVLAIAIQPSRP